ncbi:MAG: NAD-dependent deacylase [Verrucomicrobiales bacterium]|jgi:NAD-dependent deacetylase|nr:NAD-dependent deacylase [Verrucomicrobiales bacterium]
MKKKIAVLTGAGVSAESGLKTFRDSGGLWEGYDVREVATPEAWSRNPDLVLRFYNERRKSVLGAKPNFAHTGLAELERDYDVTVITQNIDDLHERAGSSRVIHLHGQIFQRCSERNPEIVSEIRGDMQLGEFANDGARWRPNIVWFGEPVPMMEMAVPVVAEADIFVVVGTSLLVYPAAGLGSYVSSLASRFVIDKKLPDIGHWRNLTAIEKPASEGVRELQRILAERQP